MNRIDEIKRLCREYAETAQMIEIAKEFDLSAPFFDMIDSFFASEEQANAPPQGYLSTKKAHIEPF